MRLLESIKISAFLSFLFSSTGYVNGHISDEVEIEEWKEIQKLFELEKIKHEESIRTGRKVEPDTPWLKTCAGWSAQELCSTIFGSGIDEETAWDEDVGLIPRAAIDYWINYDDKSVTTRCKWSNPLNQTYTSIWRNGIGCTLVEVMTEEELRSQYMGNMEPPKPLDPNIPWPQGEGFFPELAPEGVDLECLQNAAEEDFRNIITNTRAIVVIYKGQLVFEKYARKLTKDNALIGWSATKSITQTLVGIVVGENRLNIYKPAPVPEWNEDPNDPRSNITVDMMLRMSSGTRWVGDIGPTTQCIFWSDNQCAHVCALKPLVFEPDTKWNYNSGSTYILSRIVNEVRGDRQLTNFEWSKQKLFYPIGAHSMYIEFQPNQHFLGGAYGYAKPRDWARFGLLHLRNGVWIDGKRILPEGWTEYSRTASHTSPSYAAHFWKYPSVDKNVFAASGFRNQKVYILPDQEAVIVRNAMPPLVGHPVFNSDQFLSNFLKCFTKNKN